MRAKTAWASVVAISILGLVPSAVGASEPRERVAVELDRTEHHDQVPDDPQAFRPESTSGGSSAGSGYWMLDVSGEVYAFGEAWDFGGLGALNVPNCQEWVINILGYCEMAIDIEVAPPTQDFSEGEGYWVLSTTGQVMPRGGNAPNHGNFETWRNDPWMSMTSTADGRGLWGFSYQGCVETLGNAPFHGDMCDVRLNAPVVGSAVTPSGGGYYMVAQDGGIFSFGDAQFYGSMGAVRLNQPISGMVGSPTGRGYLMVAEDGGIFAFGDVPFHGSLGGSPPYWPVVSVTVR